MVSKSTNNKVSKVLYPELSYKIVGMCFDIHNTLGRYKNEKQYADALEEKLQSSDLKYKREFEISQSFAGEYRRRNIIDFLIEDEVILEIKAKSFILKEDYFQLKRYLTSANKSLGLLVNFRAKYLKPKRILNQTENSQNL